MNDDLMFEYLLQMGAMQPEQQELKRKQAMVDALRQGVQPQQGQMVSGHYVAPGWSGVASQLANAYMAKQGQGQVDQGMKGMNDRQRQMLEEMRKRRQAASAVTGQPMPIVNDDPYSQFRVGNEA